MTLPRGSVSDLPWSLKKSWERSVSGPRALCYRPFPEGYLRSLHRIGQVPMFAVKNPASASQHAAAPPNEHLSVDAMRTAREAQSSDCPKPRSIIQGESTQIKVEDCLHTGVALIGNVPSATTTTESLIWWINRCYM